MKKNLTIIETFDLAVQNHQKKNYQVAINLYNSILKIEPDHFKSIFSLGSLLLQIKRFDLAKPLLEKAIEIDPNYTDAYNSLGVIFQELGEFQKEKDCYEHSHN